MIGRSKLFFRVRCCRAGIGVKKADGIFDEIQNCRDNGVPFDRIEAGLKAFHGAVMAERRLKPSFLGGDLGVA